MPDTKEQLLKRIEDQREIMVDTMGRGSKLLELSYRRLVLDILEYLLLCDTARKLD